MKRGNRFVVRVAFHAEGATSLDLGREVLGGHVIAVVRIARPHGTMRRTARRTVLPGLCLSSCGQSGVARSPSRNAGPRAISMDDPAVFIVLMNNNPGSRQISIRFTRPGTNAIIKY
jgi:hypothetical protein